MRRIGIFLIICPVLIGLIPLLSVKTKERTQLKMGTFVNVKLKGPFWLNFDTTFNKTFACIDNVSKITNIYDRDSEVSRLNRIADLTPIPLSKGLFSLIKISAELSKTSNGAFDITVGPLVKLWKENREKFSIPSEKEIEKTLTEIGYKNIILDESKKTIFFKKNGMSIDLSAIAKGYAVDMAVEEVKRCGFKSAVINAGGDLYCLGRKDLFQKWNIGIIDPKDKKRIIKILYLSDKAVATSGGYQQYFRYKDRDYSHIIDPNTGYPVKRRKDFSVTVVAPNCTIADGIATAVCAGSESSRERIKESYPDVEIITEGLN